MSGNRLTIAGDKLLIEPQGLDGLWSFTRHIQLPLKQVKGAVFDPTVIEDPKGIRFPGLHLPRKVAGTFYTNGKRQHSTRTASGRSGMSSGWREPSSSS